MVQYLTEELALCEAKHKTVRAHALVWCSFERPRWIKKQLSAPSAGASAFPHSAAPRLFESDPFLDGSRLPMQLPCEPDTAAASTFS